MAAHPRRRFCWFLLPAVTCAAPSGPSHICWDGGAPFDLQDFPNQKQRRCARASKRCRVASLSVADIRLVNLPKLLSLIIGTHFPTTRKLNRPSQYFLNSNITSYHLASLHFARERETGSPLKNRGRSTTFRSGRVGVSSVSPFFQRSKDHES